MTDVISQVQLHILACAWKKAIYLEFGVSYILHGKRFGASNCFAIPISDIVRNQWFLLKPWWNRMQREEHEAMVTWKGVHEPPEIPESVSVERLESHFSGWRTVGPIDTWRAGKFQALQALRDLCKKHVAACPSPRILVADFRISFPGWWAGCIFFQNI